MSNHEFWPNGARMALSFSLMFEAGGKPPQMQQAPGPAVLPGAIPLPPEYKGRVYPDLRAETDIQYGYREGVPRLLEMFDRHRIKVSAFIAGEAAERSPQIAREIAERGHEIAGHGRSHSSQMHMERADELIFVKDGVEILQKITGQRQVGYNCQGLLRSINTLSVLQELGFLYHIDDVSRDEPFIVPVDGKDFVVVPYTLQNNDLSNLDRNKMSLSHFERVLKEEFDQLYSESAYRRRMMVVSTHDRVAGRPAASRVISNFITYAQSHAGVWFARKDEIARWSLDSAITPREEQAT